MTVGNINRFSHCTDELKLSLPHDYLFQKKIIAIHDHLVQLLGDDNDALELWMHRPKKRLGNLVPAALLQDEASVDAVLHCLRKELEMDSLIG